MAQRKDYISYDTCHYIYPYYITGESIISIELVCKVSVLQGSIHNKMEGCLDGSNQKKSRAYKSSLEKASKFIAAVMSSCTYVDLFDVKLHKREGYFVGGGLTLPLPPFKTPTYKQPRP